MTVRYLIPPLMVIGLGIFGLYEAAIRMAPPRPLSRANLRNGALKVSPQKVLDELSESLHISKPRLVLTEDMPSAWRAYYDEGVVYLRPSEKEPSVVAHEMGHHWHTLLGTKCGGSECEKYANFAEQHYIKFIEPRLIEKLRRENAYYQTHTKYF